MITTLQKFTAQAMATSKTYTKFTVQSVTLYYYVFVLSLLFYRIIAIIYEAYLPVFYVLTTISLILYIIRIIYTANIRPDLTIIDDLEKHMLDDQDGRDISEYLDDNDNDAYKPKPITTLKEYAKEQAKILYSELPENVRPNHGKIKQKVAKLVLAEKNRRRLLEPGKTRKHSNKIRNYLYQHLKSKHAVRITDTDANRLMLGEVLSKFIKDRNEEHGDMREADGMSHIPLAVELYFIPNAIEVEAAVLRNSKEATKQHFLHSDPSPIAMWIYSISPWLWKRWYKTTSVVASQ